MATLSQGQQADGAATGRGRGGMLVLPGPPVGLVLPSLPGALCKGKIPARGSGWRWPVLGGGG